MDLSVIFDGQYGVRRNSVLPTVTETTHHFVAILTVTLAASIQNGNAILVGDRKTGDFRCPEANVVPIGETDHRDTVIVDGSKPAR